jgi:hypothetical protein
VRERVLKGGKGLRQPLRQPLPGSLPCLTLTLTLALTLTLGVLSYSPICYPVVYAWTLGIGVAGICVCGALACDLRGACPGAYLGTNRAEISPVLRFGEISPI